MVGSERFTRLNLTVSLLSENNVERNSFRYVHVFGGFLWNVGALLFSLASPALRTVLDIRCTLSSYFLQYIIKNNHISGPPAADLEIKQLCGSSHWVDSRVNR